MLNTKWLKYGTCGKPVQLLLDKYFNSLSSLKQVTIYNCSDVHQRYITNSIKHLLWSFFGKIPLGFQIKKELEIFLRYCMKSKRDNTHHRKLKLEEFIEVLFRTKTYFFCLFLWKGTSEHIVTHIVVAKSHGI